MHAVSLVPLHKVCSASRETKAPNFLFLPRAKDELPPLSSPSLPALPSPVLLSPPLPSRSSLPSLSLSSLPFALPLISRPHKYSYGV